MFFGRYFQKLPAFCGFDQFLYIILKITIWHQKMKYNLRSTSTELETNQISVSASERENFSPRNKNKKKQDHKQKKSRKVSKKQLKGRKDKVVEKNTQNKIFHEKIMRFPLKYRKSTLRAYCFKQRDLGIPRRFSRRFIQHNKDDDQQSGESLIESEIERCKNDLFNSVRKYSETLSQKTAENPSVKQDLQEDKSKHEEISNKKKKISKQKKSKK